MRKESAVDIASLRVMREELARVIGITAQRVSQLSHLGVLPKAVGRKYPLAESVRRYCEQQKERVDDAAHRELTAQRVRLARAKADQAELARLHMLTNAIPLEMAREAFHSVMRSL